MPGSRISRLLLGGALLLSGCALAGAEMQACPATSPLCHYDLTTARARWKLPAPLEEISGLAALGTSVVVAHDDNSSLLWQLRLDRDVVDARPVSAPGTVVDGDFEGVTVAGSRLYLLSSQGAVYHADLDAAGLAGPLTVLATGVAGRCNFEGIAAAPGAVLYLACKYPRDPHPGSIRLYRLRYAAGLDGVPVVETLEVDVGQVLAALQLERLRPSGLAWLAEVGRLLVLVGKERVLLDVNPDRGTVVAWRRLSRRLHRQAEGVSLLADGALVVADEADGRAATLTIYAPER
ncbi:MAG: hypothetical protein RIC56_15055 [Pseudomonadales bacterium]